jgi:hypothetical protein
MSNKNLTPAKNNDTRATFLGRWLNDRWTKLLLLIGLILLLVNVVVPLLINIRTSTILFAFNMQYWSIHFGLFLWIVAIWVISESLEAVEDYLHYIRMATVIGVMLIIAFAIQGFIISANPYSEHSIWFSILTAITACCVARSLFLICEYWFEGKERIDLEEATYFWVLSGFFLAIFIVIGLAHIIPVSVRLRPDAWHFATTTLYQHYYTGLQEMIRSGQWSFGMVVLGFLVVTIPLACLCIAIKWVLVFFRLSSPAFLYPD